MVKLIVGTEAMFFLSLIMAFVYFSFTPGFRHQQVSALNIRSTGAFSLLLFFSSFTYWRAEVNYRSGQLKRLKYWLLLTLVLGVTFLLGQGNEYQKLLHNHITVGSSMFGTSFFTLTDFHGLHVLAGLVVIGILTCLTFLGDYSQTTASTIFSAIGVYWHFVDIVWLIVFLIVYVVPLIS